MLARACTILGVWTILIATPAWGAGGRYGTDYPFCMEAIDGGGGTHFECSYTSLEQCRIGASGTPGTCFKNPNYVSRPAETTPAETEPAPATRPAKSTGRYDPDYPFCMEVHDNSGPRYDCAYRTFEQCRQGSSASSGTCFKNPKYVSRPAETMPAEPEPAPPMRPAKSTGRYDPDYPVCMEVRDNSGPRYECMYTSFEQCRQGSLGSPGTCIKNPSYVPPPPEPAAAPIMPAPPAKPAKTTKSAKSAKSTQPPQPPPAPSPPAPSR
jgi:hypothetical protein